MTTELDAFRWPDIVARWRALARGPRPGRGPRQGARPAAMSPTSAAQALDVTAPMAVDLLLRNQSGQIELSSSDQYLVAGMLNYRDGAAGELRSEYEDGSCLTRISGYCMPGTVFPESRLLGSATCCSKTITRRNPRSRPRREPSALAA